MMAKIDPSLPVTIESWPETMALVLLPARVATVALGLLGLLAGILAATGIFGMASNAVARRLREMGIRVALGAQRIQVLRAALGRTMLLLGIGSVVGLALGALGSRVLASIVYEATVYDPLVVLGAVGAMVLIGADGRGGPSTAGGERGAGGAAARGVGANYRKGFFTVIEPKLWPCCRSSL